VRATKRILDCHRRNIASFQPNLFPTCETDLTLLRTIFAFILHPPAPHAAPGASSIAAHGARDRWPAFETPASWPRHPIGYRRGAWMVLPRIWPLETCQRDKTEKSRLAPVNSLAYDAQPPTPLRSTTPAFPGERMISQDLGSFYSTSGSATAVGFAVMHNFRRQAAWRVLYPRNLFSKSCGWTGLARISNS
jgi:hypothetical protein